MNQVVEYGDRPQSAQLVDLHVYLVPPDLWRQQLNSAVNTVIQDTVSKGFIRVLPEMKIYDLRAEVEAQLGADIIPTEYVFLKSVGRCLTQLKPKQELNLKVKHFLPPHAYQPEIFLLEATAEVKALTHETPRGLSSYSDGPLALQRPYPGNNYPNGQYPGTEPGYPGVQQGQPGRYSQPNSYDYNKNNHSNAHPSPRPVGGADTNGRATVVLETKDTRSAPQSSHSTQTVGNQVQPTVRSHDARNTHTSNTADDSGISEPTPDDPEFRREASIDSIERQKDRTQRHNEKNSDENTTNNNNKYGRPNNEEMTKKWVEDDNYHKEKSEEDSPKSTDKAKPQEDPGGESRRGSNNKSQEDDTAEVDYPSPPLLDLDDADSESANLARLDDRDKLLEELEQARLERKEAEKRREDLVRRAKAMQTKTNNRRNQARDMWKKKYFEEKKKTGPLEDESSRLRNEVDMLHRKLMAQLEVNKDKSSKRTAGNPSVKNNYKIQATKLMHDNDELKRKVETAKVKLTAEMKLRNQAETELRALRAELTQKKINSNLTRTQQLAALGGPDLTPRTPRITPRS